MDYPMTFGVMAGKKGETVAGRLIELIAIVRDYNSFRSGFIQFRCRLKTLLPRFPGFRLIPSHRLCPVVRSLGPQ
jgi:hypothetical protein